MRWLHCRQRGRRCDGAFLPAAIPEPGTENSRRAHRSKLFDVVGGGMTNGCFYSTTDFRHKNPDVIKALVEAIKEAVELVKTDRKRAAEIYLAMNKESISQDELTEILNQPNMNYSAAPLGGAILLTRRLHQAEADGLERVLLSRSA